jgi:low affinity Fe/Cu permease
MEQFVYYAPIIVVVLVFLIQERIVVTPEQLEKKHREIIRDVEKRFATLNSLDDLKSQFVEMKDKIDKIYDCLIITK